MNIKRRRPFHDEDAMASMNDIMFFLMLFFLIISTIANPNVIKLMLPKANTTEQLAKQPVTLSVTEDKRYYINTTEIPLDGLENALTTAMANNPDPTVVLRVADNLTVQDLVDVMSLGAKLKLKMVLSTTKQ
ncbi:MAG TPA: biopolymer transporter ExbD [Chitinophagales bacterium]|jgi:biopolymer transport protein ExbD|nr:biopolymer transporter ExbD [Chitinophagales bacterium]MBP6153179.1 biopolymer transporter ExbD [Chitinophagales bacterium]HQV78919.1 biopolymer transporter ExbD [Chitinophagales bacterium]HQW79285.1 biopolymer transporter ExbD [Chitinophagales bacterium]HRB69624.1 biopolymer transporter ExbD [Chitinophagales bacterium]